MCGLLGHVGNVIPLSWCKENLFPALTVGYAIWQATELASSIVCVCTGHTWGYICSKHHFGIEDGSPNSDQNPIHERNCGTFLVMYVGNGIDGLGKKENSILLSYHVLFPISDSCVPSE